jgi:1-acyl-sn-glycerol-3-phosphate acyltransferase
MLVARHFHHLLDGAVLVTGLSRPIHIVVGLDWAADRSQRRLMEWMCRSAHYPIVLRQPTLTATGSYRREELVRYTRTALRETTRLLRAGRVILVFPEGYPRGSRKADGGWLPFQTGFLKMLDSAENDGTTRVTLVPVGFVYRRAGHGRWSISARIGPPLAASERTPESVEAAVRRLSAALPELLPSPEPADGAH